MCRVGFAHHVGQSSTYVGRLAWLILCAAYNVLLLECISLSAQGADLLEIYHLAQRNDPTFEAAKYAFEAVQEKIPQARAGMLPVMNLNGSDTDTHGTSRFTSPQEVNRDVRAWTWTLQLTQPLIRAQNVYAWRESHLLVEEAHAKYAKSEQELILRVTQAYLDVLVARKNIEVTEAQLRASEEQLALAQRGFGTGTNAITDAHEAKSRADLARAQRIAALNELEARRAGLEKITGQLPETLAELQPVMIIPQPQPDDPKAWVTQARENSPDVLAPQAAFHAAGIEVSKNRAEYLPTLDMLASVGHSYSSGSLSTPSDFAMRTNSRQAGVQLTVPFFAGGATHSRVSEAIANKNRAAAELEAARRQAATDARQAYSAVVSGLAQIEALESAVESSKSAVKGNQVGYELGIRMNIDVLNAEQQLYTAQRDLVKARYDTLLQGFKLKAAAGVLTEADVLAVNELFKN
ncbi:MAG: TolC family outer membrane protein [Nitrosomonadales bacterium]|nr:TolC family outer membrane protein [Nitrosomonadales bacterium]